MTKLHSKELGNYKVSFSKNAVWVDSHEEFENLADAMEYISSEDNKWAVALIHRGGTNASTDTV